MKQEFSLVKTKQSYHGKSNANLATNTSVTIDKYKGYFDLTGSLKLPNQDPLREIILLIQRFKHINK